MAQIKYLIDFGSTFTKLVVIDLDKVEVVARTQAPSTVLQDVRIGLNEALRKAGSDKDASHLLPGDYLACSSAAGGLRMVCVGFVPDLTSEAARRAALGAGGKVISCYSYRLSNEEIAEIEKISPDIVLLSGGTEGGDSKVITYNADMIARSGLSCHTLVAGNKSAYDKIRATFEKHKKGVRFTRNVMPDIGVINTESCNEEIRELFIKHIVKARGIPEDVQMPTPEAVLKAARLISQGVGSKGGVGDVVVVDVGGATTDIDSIGSGRPTQSGTVLRGLPEPFAKRTVEGDLGVRYSIDILAEIGRREGMFLNPRDDEVIKRLSVINRLPQNEDEVACDTTLAYISVKVATERHVGRIETVYAPTGEVNVQYGKDLSNVECVIGTGGPIIFSPNPRKVLEGVLFDSTKPYYLKPKSPKFYLDTRYIFYAAGLLAQSEPEKALALLKRDLKEI